MTKKGYDAYISTVEVRDRIFYRIRIGKYSSEEIALKAAEKLKKKEKLEDGVWVTSM